MIKLEKPQVILHSIVLLFLAILFVKMLTVPLYPELSWTDVRKNIFFRFDSLLIGVLLAYIYIYHDKLFYILGKKRSFLIAVSFMALLVIWYYSQRDMGLDSDFFSKTWMFPITSFLLAIIMVYFYCHVERESIYSYYGSRLAYSIYLIHFLFLDVCIKWAHSYQTFYVSMGLLILFLSVTVVVAYLLYRFYELPMMNLRERYA